MKRSLFIGRWQPFHDGHRKLVQTVLDEGKKVLIAIRDTPINEKDPYSVEERWAMIREVFPNEDLVRIMVIPDIEEVVYGREVGWGVRQLKLDEDTEAISGTKEREKLRANGELL